MALKISQREARLRGEAVPALLTGAPVLDHEEIVTQAMEFARDANPPSEPDFVDGFIAGAQFAVGIYEARLAEVSQLRDQYQGDLIKVNAALDGHANEIIRLSARLAEAISLMKEASPAMDLISFTISERFDRFLAVYAKEDKP